MLSSQLHIITAPFINACHFVQIKSTIIIFIIIMIATLSNYQDLSIKQRKLLRGYLKTLCCHIDLLFSDIFAFLIFSDIAAHGKSQNLITLCLVTGRSTHGMLTIAAHGTSQKTTFIWQTKSDNRYFKKMCLLGWHIISPRPEK